MNLGRPGQDSQRPQHHQLFIEIQNNCPLCLSILAIHVRFLSDAQSLVEQAECGKCGVVTRTKDHKVH